MLAGTHHSHHCTSTSTSLHVRVQFTGWHDVPLSEVGVEEATGAGKLIAEEGFQFDAVYTSGVRRIVQYDLLASLLVADICSCIASTRADMFAALTCHLAVLKRAIKTAWICMEQTKQVSSSLQLDTFICDSISLRGSRLQVHTMLMQCTSHYSNKHLLDCKYLTSPQTVYTILLRCGYQSRMLGS
jgi:Histidine phosphatase superfamily (branch 1)